jgi:hypothetical protein
MRKERGISLVALIFTIIVIIILASIAIYYGVNKNLQEATFTSIYSEISEVGDAVGRRGVFNTMDEETYSLVGTKLGDGDEKVDVSGVIEGNSFRLPNGSTYGEGYYLIKAEETKDLNLQGVKGDYIVNYATGEVIAVKPLLYEGKELYSMTDVSTAILGDSAVTDAKYDSVKGVNAPILGTGMVPVIYDEGSDCWVIVSKDSAEWYDYRTIEEGATPDMANRWANAMLLDMLQTEDYTNSQIMNMTAAELDTNLVNQKVTTMGSMFVWVPRYTYKIDSVTQDIDIKFSVLLQDYTSDGYVINPAFYYGGYIGSNDLNPNAGYTAGGTDLTGIWVSKFEAGIAD